MVTIATNCNTFTAAGTAFFFFSHMNTQHAKWVFHCGKYHFLFSLNNSEVSSF